LWRLEFERLRRLRGELLARARRSGVAVAELASSHRLSVNRLLLW
jgi:hypothetical protein